MRRLTGIVLLAALAAGCGSTSSGVKPATSPTVPTEAQLKAAAIARCHTAAQRQLKAPDTVRWDSTTTGTSRSGGWVVNGKLSSENGFGALVQSGYSCTVDYVGQTAGRPRFKVKSIVF